MRCSFHNLWHGNILYSGTVALQHRTLTSLTRRQRQQLSRSNFCNYLQSMNQESAPGCEEEGGGRLGAETSYEWVTSRLWVIGLQASTLLNMLSGLEWRDKEDSSTQWTNSSWIKWDGLLGVHPRRWCQDLIGKGDLSSSNSHSHRARWGCVDFASSVYSSRSPCSVSPCTWGLSR